MRGADYTATTMKITANGQISIPAEVRRRWNTDRVVVIDTPNGLLVRPFDPDLIRTLKGKYKAYATETVDEGRRRTREEDAELEEERERARTRRLRPGGVSHR